MPENRCIVHGIHNAARDLAISITGQFRSHTRIAYPLRESAPQRGRSRSTKTPITTCRCFACVKRCGTGDADYANQESRQSRSKTKQTRCPRNFVVSLAQLQGDFVDISLAAEPLLSLAVTVTSQRVESVLRNIVQGLASQPGVALTRIWLLPSADLCGPGQEPSRSPEQTEYLRLVASAGTPVNSPGEDWSFLQGHFSRLPLNVGRVGQVAANRNPILIKDLLSMRACFSDRAAIAGFAASPEISRGILATNLVSKCGRQRR